MFLRLENEPQYLILVLIEICSYDRVLKKTVNYQCWTTKLEF